MTNLTTTEARALTPEQLFERFLRLSIADGVASSRTLQAYRQGFAAFFQWCHARHLDPVAATFDHIQQYRLELAAKNKRATIRLRLRGVRILYEAMVRWGRRPDNPAAGVRAPKDRTGQDVKVLQKALTPEQARTFIEALPELTDVPGARDRALLLIAVFHGLRAEELASLMTQDLGPGADFITIKGKGDKQRIAALLPIVQQSLRAWIGMRGLFPWNSVLFYRLDVPGAMPLSVRSIERIADFYLRKAGLKQPGRSIHALRHTYALLAALGGCDREALAASMGHADKRTTDIYLTAAATLQKPAALAAWATFQRTEKTMNKVIIP